jgi:mannose-6-phosphate isomerase-like protein (cupin superfamily)
MDVHIQSRDGAERLGSAALLAAFDDLMVSEYVLEPGTEPGDPHYHANHSDAFYVLEGELEFRIDGRPVRASAGTLVVAPRGVVYAARRRRDDTEGYGARMSASTEAAEPAPQGSGGQASRASRSP